MQAATRIRQPIINRVDAILLIAYQTADHQPIRCIYSPIDLDRRRQSDCHYDGGESNKCKDDLCQHFVLASGQLVFVVEKHPWDLSSSQNRPLSRLYQDVAVQHAPVDTVEGFLSGLIRSRSMTNE